MAAARIRDITRRFSVLMLERWLYTYRRGSLAVLMPSAAPTAVVRAACPTRSGALLLTSA